MRCPFAPEIDVGERCARVACWMHHVRAKGGCAAADTGSTHLVAADVARIYGESAGAAQERVSRGRRKIAAFLSLVEALEDSETVEDCCRACGAVGCRGGERCRQDCLEMATLRAWLPLDKVVKMSPSRWRAALEVKRTGSEAFSIKA